MDGENNNQPPAEDMDGQQPDMGMDMDPAMDGAQDLGQQQPLDDGQMLPEGQDQQEFGGIDPNQQINQDFLGGQQQPLMDQGYNQDLGAGEGEGEGMFRGDDLGGQPEGDDDVDDYFDDAGDIGYLPADHVSTLSQTFKKLPFPHLTFLFSH